MRSPSPTRLAELLICGCDRALGGASSGWCRSKAGRSERIRGSEVKLCRGGGQLVAHSSEPPQPQGSSTFTCGAFFQVTSTFQMKNSVEIPRIAAPTVETTFRVVKSSTGR